MNQDPSSPALYACPRDVNNLQCSRRWDTAPLPLPERVKGFVRRYRDFALAVLLLAAPAGAQTVFSSTAVGSQNGAANVQITIQTAGQVHTVSVLTMGVAGLDYAQGSTGSSCADNSFNAGQTCMVPVSFTPTAPGTRAGAVVLTDSSGKVLGTSFLTGQGIGGLGVMSPGTMLTIAGDGQWSSVKDGSIASSADLNLPQSLAVDGAGNIYIADSAHNRIRRVDAKTQVITTIAGNGESGYSGDGGAAGEAVLNTPDFVTLDGAGNLYIADNGNNVIRMITAAGSDISVNSLITTVAGNGTAGSGGDTGPAINASLSGPQGVTISPAGELYIADTKNHLIRKVTLSGVITAVAGNGAISGNGNGTYSGDGGPATSAGLNAPFAVAFDTAGNMYIPDSANNVIRKVNTSGIISTFGGDGNEGFKGDGSPVSQAEFYSPSGLVFDAAGNLYIADTQNNRVRKVSAGSRQIETIAGNGVGKYTSDGVNAALAGLYGPYGMFIDMKGDLFIADYFDHRIREVPSSLAILTFQTAIRQDQVSNPQSQGIENDGNAPLPLLSLTTDVNATIDAASTTCAGSTTLAVGATCLVGAEFAPTEVGDPITGNIDIAANASNAQPNPYDIQVVGQSLALNSTSITLLSTADPSSYGQTVNFVANTTTGIGSPSGDVTFFDGKTALGSPIQVNGSGNATFTTGALAVGLHPITASYGGDAQHGTSTSAVLAQIVNESTTVSLAVSQDPIPLNSMLRLTAIVGAKAGGIMPDGTIVFYDGFAVIGTSVLNEGVATLSTASLAAGEHTISAAYNGDAANYIQASTSSTVSVDVQAQSTTQLLSSTNPSVFGDSVIFTATVTSVGNGAGATGTVQFVADGKPLGTAQLSNGVAQYSTPSLPAGVHAISAVYEASAANASSTSAVMDQVVQETTTATQSSFSPSPGIAGKSVALTATIKLVTGAGIPTGQLTFTDAGKVLGTATLSGSGAATINANLASGTHPIVVTYAGDANNAGSVSATLRVPVVLATTEIKVSSSANPAIVESTLRFTANVTGNGGIPAGAVTFSSDGSVLGTSALDSNGTAAFSTSALIVGSHAITANYSGDVNDAVSISNTLTQGVIAIASTTSLGTAATNSSNSTLVLVATVVGAGGPPPTGTVSFLNGNTVIGTATLDASGVATLTPDVNSGSLTVTAQYAGDAIHLPSNSSQITVTSGGLGFDVSMNPPSLNLQSGKNNTLTVTYKSTNGFADQIGLGCSDLPAMMNCHFSNDSINLAANGIRTVQLTVDTGQPLSGGNQAENRSGTPRVFYAGFALPGALIAGLLLWLNRKRYPVLFSLFAVVLLGAAGLSLSGCGGIDMGSVAPGTYTIQVTGAGIQSNVTRSVNLQIQVTK